MARQKFLPSRERPLLAEKDVSQIIINILKLTVVMLLPGSYLMGLS